MLWVETHILSNGLLCFVMSKRAAVVFDSAGTLLSMYRIAKDINKNLMLCDVSTVAMASKKKECVIAVIHMEDVEDIQQLPSSMPIRDFFDTYNIDIGITCTSQPITKDAVIKTVKKDDKATVRDLQEVLDEVLSGYNNRYYVGIGIMVDMDAQNIPYALSSRGSLFPHVKKIIAALHQLGVDVYIASGDRQLDIEHLADCIGVMQERSFGLSTPLRKREIIDRLKKEYNPVIMVGDAINDLLAFEASDMAVLTLQQYNMHPPRLLESVDKTINRLDELVPIVKEFID